MRRTLTGRVGFGQSGGRALAPRRYAASLQFVAGAALLVSTVVAMTVVSIGIARANAPEAAVADAADNSISIAILLALILAGWGGLTALMARRD